MNCYNHLERPAVAQCGKCGKFLCKQCVIEGPTILCEECSNTMYQEQDTLDYQLRQKQSKNIKVSVTIFICYMIFVVIHCLLSKVFRLSSFLVNVFGGLLIAGIPYGWRKLNNTKLRVILILPILGWIIYFGIKIQVAYWIGWYYLIKDIILYKTNITKSKKYR